MSINIGFTPSHRNLFDVEWAIEMRSRTIKALSKILKEDVDFIFPDKSLTPGGLVRSEEDANKVINLFKDKDIKGLIIGTMTFGEELPVLTIAEEFRKLPIFLFGTKEGPFKEDGKRSSDSFCGTISISSGLHRRGMKFEFGDIYFPEEKNFSDDISSFIKVCTAYEKFIGARIGQIGVKPSPFETCAINEANLIKKFNQRIVTYSLLGLYNDLNNINDSDKKVIDIVNEINSKADTTLVPKDILKKLAKLEICISEFVERENLVAISFQCWPDIQQILGISICMTLGRLTEKGLIAACETDIHGAISMFNQYFISLKKKVPHFIDWTIMNQQNKNIFLAWHCGNAPMCLSHSKPIIRSHYAFDKMFNNKKSFATGEFQLKDGPVTINRLVEYDGDFKMLSVNGVSKIISDDIEKIRGSYSWIEVPNLKKLYRTIIEEGFTHHASMIYGDIDKEIKNLCKFLGIKIISI